METVTHWSDIRPGDMLLASDGALGYLVIETRIKYPNSTHGSGSSYRGHVVTITLMALWKFYRHRIVEMNRFEADMIESPFQVMRATT